MRVRYLTEELLRFVSVRSSPIHGKGVFARVPFAPGDYIGTYWGNRGDRERHTPYTLFVTHGDGGTDRVEGKNPLRYLNHSDDPNARFDGIHLYAARHIRPGEEITFDYTDGEGGIEFREQA